MTGFIGLAPIYLNGALALFFILVFPGLVVARALDITNFPQRWTVVFLGSLTINHLWVTLIAALHLDPVQAYRAGAGLLTAILIWQMVRKNRSELATPTHRGASTLLLSDIGWFVLSLLFLGLTYINVWKHGVPNIFEGGDVSVSWNTWSLAWAQGKFPTAVGYPQFVPTIWAITYIFTGSNEQYFAFYVYILWLVVPLALNAMNLGRLGWWQPIVPGLALLWLITEIRDPWLKSCLPQGYPDWVAAIFAFSGVALFVSSAPDTRFDKEKITAALISLCLLSIAAATKPTYGLFAAAVFIAVCTDAARLLPHRQRAGLIAGAAGLLSVFAAAYATYYLQFSFHRIPDHSLPIVERLQGALALINATFSLPFRVWVFAGLLLSPFLTRVRWLALPLILGFSSWALMLSYDLRNLLGFLLIGAFVPFFALARALAPVGGSLLSTRRWTVSDGVAAIGIAFFCVCLTLPLAQSDRELKQRFATEQLSKGAGLQINRKIEQLLLEGCTIFNADSYLETIAAFAGFQDKIIRFFSTLPLEDGLINAVNQASGCTSFFFPPDRTHPSIQKLIAETTKAKNYTKVIEGSGMELLVSRPGRLNPG